MNTSLNNKMLRETGSPKTGLRIFLSLCLSIACISTARPVSISWYDDSASSFGLTVSGTGGATNAAQWFPSSTSLMSPSGLWSFAGGFQAYPLAEGLNITQYNSKVSFTSLGESLVFPSYADILPFSNPHDGNTSAPVRPSNPFYSWHDHFTIDITSIPDRSLPQTWSWVMNVSGAGPALSGSNPVPDDSSTFALLTVALIGLFVVSAGRFRRFSPCSKSSKTALIREEASWVDGRF